MSKPNKDISMMFNLLARIFDEGTTYYKVTIMIPSGVLPNYYDTVVERRKFIVENNTRVNEVYTHIYRLIQRREYPSISITISVQNNYKYFTRTFFVNNRNQEKLLKFLRDCLDLTGKKYVPRRKYIHYPPGTVGY